MTIRRSFEHERWEKLFPSTIVKESNGKLLDSLVKFEERLAKFCYTPLSLGLKPDRCGRDSETYTGIWRRTSTSPPVINDAFHMTLRRNSTVPVRVSSDLPIYIAPRPRVKQQSARISSSNFKWSPAGKRGFMDSSSSKSGNNNQRLISRKLISRDKNR